MISAEEIKNKHFSKAGMSGYKKIEVDVFLDEIVSTLNYLTATHSANEKKIADYELKLSEYKNDEQAIQSALVNAERVSDQIKSEAQQTANDTVFGANKQAEEIKSAAEAEAEAIINDAKEKAELILGEAQKLSRELSETTEKMTRESIEAATRRAEEINSAAKASVSEQQALFDELKTQVAVFKRDIEARFAEQQRLLAAIPDEAPLNPQQAAAMVDEDCKAPADEEIFEETDIENIIGKMKTNEEKTAELVNEAAKANAESSRSDRINEATEESASRPTKTSSFTVCLDFDEDDEPSEDEAELDSDLVNDEQSETENQNVKNDSSYSFSGDVADAEV